MCLKNIPEDLKNKTLTNLPNEFECYKMVWNNDKPEYGKVTTLKSGKQKKSSEPKFLIGKVLKAQNRINNGHRSKLFYKPGFHAWINRPLSSDNCFKIITCKAYKKDITFIGATTASYQDKSLCVVLDKIERIS